MTEALRVAHISDLHIRSYEYLDEVRFTLNELIESLKKEKPDLIFLGGDIYHSKLTVTNEYFDICSKMFRDMSELATVIVILGNHDLALNNPARQDAVSPVLSALGKTKHPIHFSKKSTDRVAIDKNGKIFYFHCLSILDEKSKWPNQDSIFKGIQDKEWDEEAVHIATYHGSINGCIVDNGWTSRGNTDSLDIFSGFDFAMLGDIHKFQMMTDRIAYPGSLRQGNFGEDTEKGYLLWNIESKDKFEIDRIILPQKRYFYTIEIDKAEDLQLDSSIKHGSRIRVLVKDRVGLVEEAQIKDKIKEWYKPYNDVTIISSFDGSSVQSVVSGDEEFSHDNLRSLDVQRKLIKNFFKNENLTEEQFNEICELDKKYNSFVDVSAHRNSIWNIKKLKWSNLFSYGSDNEIDFTRQSGLIGIFGANGQGKTSSIEALCYGLFNSINKEGATKNAEYINFRKKKCEVEICIDFNDEEYKIKRETTKPVKDGSPPKNEIEFYKKISGKKVSLNGETKPDTNQNIKNIFGTIDDFVSTSLCPQEGLTKFIDLRGTDKKKIFNKFFDLDFFETKHDLADKDHSAIKSKLKEVALVNFEENLSKINSKLSESKEALTEAYKEKGALEASVEALNEETLSESLKLQQSEFSGDIVKIINEYEKIIKDIDAAKLQLGNNSSNHDSSSIEQQKINILQSLSEFKLKLSDLKSKRQTYETKKEAASLLKKIPCGDQYPSCAFIQKAHIANKEIKELDSSIFDSIDVLEKDIQAFERALEVVEQERNKINKLNSLILSLENLELKKSKLKEQIDLYEKCKNSVLENEKINKNLQEIKAKKEKIHGELGAIGHQLSSNNKLIGSLESQKEDVENKMKEIFEMRNKSFYYELYLKAMGKNGISYSVASQKLPVVNEEANRILRQVVDYSVLIEDNEEEKSIKLFLIRDKEKTPVELASGAEKTMISLALRTALWRVTSIPKTPCLFLDEPFGFMEEGKQDAIIKMLQYLKNYFKHIFIITHDSNLKNVVDSAIYIERNEEGFAFCKA